MSVSLYGSGQTVVQLITATSTSTVSTTSTSLVTTGFSATITPQSTSNKILVQFITYPNAPSGQHVSFGIYRGASNIASGFATGLGSTTNLNTMCPIMTLDSPATTSATTYTLYFATQGGTANIQGDGATDFPAIVTLTEIAYA